MKKLTNKKGFTLIEMLVVIAIIAVLVAIIIPVVSAATTKAAAATDAANLRSYKAEITTAYLSKDKATTTTGETSTTVNKVDVASDNTVTITGINTPAMKDVGDAVTGCEAAEANENTDFVVTYDGSAFTVTYQGFTINEFATAADTGELAAKTAGG